MSKIDEKRLWIIEARDGAWGANGICKGELVRCGECRWWSKDEPDDEYGYCYNGKIIGSTKENWHCADGKRKDNTNLKGETK